MATLPELLGGPDKRAAVVSDSLKVLDAEVADKGGISGMAVKTGYKVVKGISPDFLQKVVNGLLDDFLVALDPYYQQAVSSGKNPKDVLVANSPQVADSLLAITDARAERAKNPMIAKTYGKLRGTAKKHVEAAVPRLGELFERHVN